MSIKKPQLYILLIATICLSIFQILKPEKQIRRSFLSGINISEYSSRGIVDRIINLKIEATSKNDIVATVSLPFDFDQELHYKWTLGQNVTLKEGLLQGSISKGFIKNQIERIQISVEGYTSENNRHIGFEIWGTKNNKRIYADGLISSQKENSFEDIVRHVEELKTKKSGVKK